MDVVRALVVAILLATAGLSAQGPTPPAQTSGTLATTGSVPLNVSGYASVAFQLTGTFVATITFEGSVDGTNYQAINVTPTNSSSATTTATSTGVWVGSVGGLKSARARVSAYTSGSVVISVQAALSGGGSGGGGGGGSAPSGTIGAAVPATASPVAVKDNAGNLAYITLDGSGNVPVAVTGAGSGGTSSVDGSAYTAGATAGTPLMGARDDAGTTACAEDKNCIARVTSARELMVSASGTVTANAGTNLNTSLLALEAGGNLASIKAKTDNIPALGQALAAASTPVVLTAAQLSTLTPLSSVTATQATATNLNAAVVGTGTAGVPAGNILTVQGVASMTKLLVTPDSVALPANQSVNVNQLAGTTTDTNSGVKSAGTLRVVLATDQPALTNKLLVTPDSVALPANQSVNVNQLAGTTTDTNSGTKSAGTLRVVLATDQPALTNKLLVTPDSVALPANQSVNISQINAVTPLMGNGASGTGAQRVTIANDSTGVLALTTGSAQIGHLEANQSVNNAQVNGVTISTGAGATGTGVQRTNDVASSATGAAPPASAHYIGGVGSGATGGFVVPFTSCDTPKAITITSATTTLMITGVSGRHIYICNINMLTAIANNVAPISGTGATCGTGTTGIAGGTTAANGYNFAANGGIALNGGSGWTWRTTATGDSICLITSAAGPLAGSITYAIY